LDVFYANKGWNWNMLLRLAPRSESSEKVVRKAAPEVNVTILENCFLRKMAKKMAFLA
jgi:hypothetical protein